MTSSVRSYIYTEPRCIRMKVTRNKEAPYMQIALTKALSKDF